MACSACAASVERRLRETPGVVSAEVSLSSRSATIEWQPDVVGLEQLKHRVNEIGFDLITDTGQSVAEIERREYGRLLRKTLLSWLFAIVVMSLQMGWINAGSADVTRQLLFILALSNIVVCGGDIYRKALRGMRHGIMGMETLVMLSTSVSFLYSAAVTFSSQTATETYYDASVMIITFLLTGRLLEEYARRGTSSSIRRLMGLQPKTARVVGQEGVTAVPLSTISVGDIIEVHAGETMPVDGKVTWATSFMDSQSAFVDESMISGEPTPVAKHVGDKCLAGTMLGQGTLRYRAQQIGEQTALAAIVRTVQQAQNSKPPVQRIVDRMALVFVPVVVGLSLLTFLVWWAVSGSEGLSRAVVSAVAVLVVACPCAMGLATPTAIMVGIGKAARANILIKDAVALENMRKVDVVVMDKTGTLTLPRTDIDFTKTASLPPEERETLKPHAREAVEALRHMGVDIWLMSGDHAEAVGHWASLAGISHWQDSVLPDDKSGLVSRLQSEGHCVAMIGDGINDSQALALADVSIAMGKGTDVAMDVSQVTLMGDDLMRIPEALTLSAQTVRLIRQNLFWAFVYNLVSIPLAAGALRLFGIDFQITPMWASLLMAASSLSVVANSLRLAKRH